MAMMAVGGRGGDESTIKIKWWVWLALNGVRGCISILIMFI